ncbi:MAG: hypothetical protein Q9170_003377 [Blastenia crenularia]
MDIGDQRSKYAIHEAAREGRLGEVESLLNANPRLAIRRDDDERLPIHWALSNSHQATVELLVSRKDFDPDVQDGSGWTPLMIASSLKEGDALVDLLLSKDADVDIKNYNGQTALHFCASKNKLDIARKLISKKASARAKDKRQQLPLHRAAAIGSVPMVNLLLQNRSPLNATDSAGYTALHHGMLSLPFMDWSNVSRVRMLQSGLSSLADIFASKAISEGHGDTALVLLKAGAETDKQDVDGHLAIDLAPDTKIRKFILQSAEREGVDLE